MKSIIELYAVNFAFFTETDDGEIEDRLAMD